MLRRGLNFHSRDPWGRGLGWCRRLKEGRGGKGKRKFISVPYFVTSYDISGLCAITKP